MSRSTGSSSCSRRALVMAALLAAGCGGKVVLDDTGGTTGAGGAGGGSATGQGCDVTMDGLQICVSASGAAGAALAQACMGEGGTLVDVCSDSGRLGTCTLTASGIQETVSYYSGGSITAAEAEMACTSGQGTWQSG